MLLTCEVVSVTSREPEPGKVYTDVVLLDRDPVGALRNTVDYVADRDSVAKLCPKGIQAGMKLKVGVTELQCIEKGPSKGRFRVRGPVLELLK